MISTTPRLLHGREILGVARHQGNLKPNGYGRNKTIWKLERKALPARHRLDGSGPNVVVTYRRYLFVLIEPS